MTDDQIVGGATLYRPGASFTPLIVYRLQVIQRDTQSFKLLWSIALLSA
jgi:hypothetical protein